MNAQSMKPRWGIVKFGDMVKNTNLIERVPEATGIKRIIGLEHLDSENLHIRRWNTTENGTSFSRKFVPGQTLFGKRRAYQRKVAFAEFEGLCSGDILTFQTKDEKALLPELLPFICQSDAFFEHALDTSAGSLSPRTSWKALKDFKFRLPPTKEQKRITEILWAADEVVEKWISTFLEIQKLSYAFSVNNFLLHEARKKNPIIPTGWSIGPITKVVNIDPRMPRYLSDDLEISFVPMEDILEIGGISKKEDKELGKVRKGYTYFAEGDILFAKITPCMENNKGAIAEGLTNGIAMGSTEFFVLRPKKDLDRNFVYHLSMFKTFRKKAERWMQGSAGQRRVPKDFFTKRPIVIPPQKKRKQIGKILQSIDSHKRNINRHIELMNNTRTRLLNSFFHGLS